MFPVNFIKFFRASEHLNIFRELGKEQAQKKLAKLQKVAGLEILLDFRDDIRDLMTIIQNYPALVHFNPILHKKPYSTLLYSARNSSATPAL